MAESSRFKRSDLKAPDPFFETVGNARRYFEKHRSRVIAIAATVTVVFVGGAAINAYVTRAARNSAATFFRGSEAFESESFEAAKTGLSNLGETGSRPYRQLANLYNADLASAEGRYQHAANLYGGFAEAMKTPYLKQIGWLGQGFAFEMQALNEEAAGAFDKAAGLEGPFREDSLRARLRVADKLEDSAAASVAIETLLELFPGVDDADQLAGRLSERLAANASTAAE
jgi:hypothetical protein